MAITTLEAGPSFTGLDRRLTGERFRPLLHDLSTNLFEAESGRTRAARYGGVLLGLAEQIRGDNILDQLWTADNSTPEQRERWDALLDGEGIDAPFQSPAVTVTPERFRSVSIMRHPGNLQRAHITMLTPKKSSSTRGYVGYTMTNVALYPGDDVGAVADHRDVRALSGAVDRYARALDSYWPFGRIRRLEHAANDAVQPSYSIASRNRYSAKNVADIVLTVADIIRNGAKKAGIDIEQLNPEVPHDAAIGAT